MDNSISYIALIVSIVSFYMSYMLKKNEHERNIKDNINNIVTKLIDLNAEYNILINDYSIDEKIRHINSSAIQQKISSLSKQATYLVDKKPDIITDNEYATIAIGLNFDNELLAEEYWKKAINRSKNDFYKIINLRAYADFLFRQGNHELGREKFNEALKIFNKNNTDFNKITNAYTYQMWMNSEFYNGYIEEAKSHYSKAKALYEQISNPYSKDLNLKNLQEIYESLMIQQNTGEQ